MGLGLRWLAAILAGCASASELLFAEQYNASDGEHSLSVQAVPLALEKDDGTMSPTLFETRGYAYGTNAGTVPGPTFRMNPGGTLQISLTNNLNQADNIDCHTTGTEFCESETTNFHTHGLHISPSGPDGNDISSDSIFVILPPGGNTQRYSFTIPDNHMPGTHWYHPHHHHATGLQAGGGAAGLIIVDDPAGYLPDVYMNMIEKVLFVSYHSFQRLQRLARNSMTTLLNNSEDILLENNFTEGQYLVNGQRKPTVTIEADKWYRFRLVFAAVELLWELQLTPVSGGGVCQALLLAKDGIYLDKIPRVVTEIPLFPGARADVAVSCTCPSPPCTWSSAPESDPQNNILTLQITEAGDGTPAPELPEYSPQRPCYLADLRSAVVPEANKVKINFAGERRAVEFNGVGESMTYENTHRNGSTMADWPPMGTFNIGEVYEIDVLGLDGHPLHIHVSPFQVVTMPMANYHDGFLQSGDWHDTLEMPDIGGDDEIRIRMQMDTFGGKMVTHCHILHHEDEGMMNYILIEGNEGGKFECAKSLAQTCHDGAFSTTPPNHPVDATCISSSPAQPTFPAPSPPTPPPAPSPSPSNLPWIIGGVVVAVLVVLGIVAFLNSSPTPTADSTDGAELAENREA